MHLPVFWVLICTFGSTKKCKIWVKWCNPTTVTFWLYLTKTLIFSDLPIISLKYCSPVKHVYFREADSGGDPKFSKMVALQRPQDRKMVALQRPKFAQKSLFFEIFAAPSAPRPILCFTTILYIKFDHILQILSKFRHFRKNFTKMTDFQKIYWNSDPENPRKITFYCIFCSLFFEKW